MPWSEIGRVSESISNWTRPTDGWAAPRRASRSISFGGNGGGAGVFVRAVAGSAGFVPVDRGEVAVGEGIGGARTIGGAGADGGEHFSQLEKSPGLDEDDFAGATGKSGDAGVHAGGNENGAGGDRAPFREIEPVVAIQPAGRTQRGEVGEMQRLGEGTGLGLAIVARRAADAGGKLEFESPVRNGRGTRFLVWLPLGDPTR